MILEEYSAGKRDFRAANLRGVDLRAADLSDANLSGANLSAADLRDANLRAADLSGADLRAADLSDANLSAADLSGAQGLLDPITWLEEHFEKDDQGIIVYKIFGLHYKTPDFWKIEASSIITEIVNPCPGSDCACGVNVATLDWVKKEASYPDTTIWKCRIRWPWLVGVVVPYRADGKIRTARLELLEIVEVQ